MFDIKQSVSNDPPDEMDRILFIFCPWTVDEHTRNAASRQLIEYRANPRSGEYMLDRAREFKERFAPRASADLFVAGEAVIPEEYLSWVRRVGALPAKGNAYDAVIMLYPDAIGLGYTEIEQKIPHLGAPVCFVINGRRRIFVWDNTSRRALAWRRLLYRPSLPEILFASFIFLAGVWFTLIDMGKGRGRG